MYIYYTNKNCNTKKRIFFFNLLLQLKIFYYLSILLTYCNTTLDIHGILSDRELLLIHFRFYWFLEYRPDKNGAHTHPINTIWLRLPVYQIATNKRLR